MWNDEYRPSGECVGPSLLFGSGVSPNSSFRAAVNIVSELVFSHRSEHWNLILAELRVLSG
jgi:hypothetical protein